MTNFLEAVRWDLLGSGFQIALCAGVLVGWIRRRAKRRSAAPVEADTASPVFAREMFRQTVRQQTEQALQNILAAVEAERERLQHALADGDAAPCPAEAESGRTADASAAFRWGDPEAGRDQRSRYGALDALGEQGLSSRQIADRLKLPVGEIELARKLRQGSHENHPAGAVRQ